MLSKQSIIGDLVDENNTKSINNQLEAEIYGKLNKKAKIDKTFNPVSCNSISKMSICVDYIGSFWIKKQMQFACGYSGVLSDKPCESGSIGGCEVGKGSFNDMIIWMYPYGASPIAAGTVKSAKPACDTNPMGTWVGAR